MPVAQIKAMAGDASGIHHPAANAPHAIAGKAQQTGHKGGHQSENRSRPVSDGASRKTPQQDPAVFDSITPATQGSIPREHVPQQLVDRQRLHANAPMIAADGRHPFVGDAGGIDADENDLAPEGIRRRLAGEHFVHRVGDEFLRTLEVEEHLPPKGIRPDVGAIVGLEASQPGLAPEQGSLILRVQSRFDTLALQVEHRQAETAAHKSCSPESESANNRLRRTLGMV